MNWFKENKFLSGLLGAVVVGAGVLGYLLYSAMGASDEASQAFDSTSAELKRLHELPIYPNPQNLKKLDEQQKQFQDRADVLIKTVANMAPPLEQLTPEQFQDRLREMVNNLVRDAAAANMELPKPFYMGFDTYQGTPPRPGATGVLDRDLKATDFIFRQMLTAKVSQIKSVYRTPLPEESGNVAPAEAASGPGKGAPGARSAAAPSLVQKHTLLITTYGTQKSFQDVMNTLVAEKKFFLIPREVVVKNEVPTGPSRIVATAPDGSPVPTDPLGVPPTDPNVKTKVYTFIVGEEKVITDLQIELATFNQAATAPKAGNSKPANRP